MPTRRSPLEVLPREISAALASERYWFVIGGQAVRCIVPYRPSRDVDFGVLTAKDVTGLLATKVHAILDRGTRRDFFDLYVLLQVEGLGLLECLSALTKVYATEVNSGLVLRALTYFDDADAEAELPGEGKGDWRKVRDFFSTAVAALLVPPTRPLEIQSRVVDVQLRELPSPRRMGKRKARTRR